MHVCFTKKHTCLSSLSIYCSKNIAFKKMIIAGPKVNTKIIMNQTIDILDFISISGKEK